MPSNSKIQRIPKGLVEKAVDVHRLTNISKIKSYEILGQVTPKIISHKVIKRGRRKSLRILGAWDFEL